ncbi:hypothetical protein GQ602_003722 [Ophiocordyceps camponoti-floridani]|uniref:Uncharacterized protein n=1 Tax=Ophiocordyceps camponoti-floridani TaxID=2030778 RepID=A0A8H4Q8V1_9HYPO|nr:hypothetical protein GQ602_003722 [Ophiocordyceps camponoti-floridani]
MLPGSVAAFLDEAPLTRKELINGPPETCLAFTQWQKLSAFLLHPTRDQRTPLPINNTTTSRAHSLTTALNEALKPLATTSSEQTSHLEAVIMECAKLGYVLLSHPSDWLFITQDERKTGEASRVVVVVVEAGLVKLGDGEGMPYSSPVRVVEPVVQTVSCLQLVQSCTQDLQHLIQLRNDNISVLQAKPLDLNRVDSVIGQANSGLAEARRIVEKFRPEAHPGCKTPLRKRLAWVLGDSLEFQSQLPVISRHHATVLAEINHVRQLALWAAPSRGKGIGSGAGAETADQFDNLLLLGDLIGDDVSVLSKGSSATLRPQSSYSFFDSEKQMIEYSDLPEAVFPDKAAEQFPASRGLHHPDRPSHAGKTGGYSLDALEDSGLTILLDGQSQPLHELESFPQQQRSTSHHPYSQSPYLLPEIFQSTVSSLSTAPDCDAPERAKSVHIQAYDETVSEVSQRSGSGPPHNSSQQSASRQAAISPRPSYQELSSQPRTPQERYRPPLPPKRGLTEQGRGTPASLIPGVSSQSSMQIAERSCKRNETWPRLAPFGTRYRFPEQTFSGRGVGTQRDEWRAPDGRE